MRKLSVKFTINACFISRILDPKIKDPETGIKFPLMNITLEKRKKNFEFFKDGIFW